jgi:hypothetical protein
VNIYRVEIAAMKSRKSDHLSQIARKALPNVKYRAEKVPGLHSGPYLRRYSMTLHLTQHTYLKPFCWFRL